MNEIIHRVDIHENNKKRFDLPTRLIAKTFVFRLIYGGTAWSYANDPDFKEVKYNEKEWQNVIDEFYKKYQGIKYWHDKLLEEVLLTKELIMPTGRRFSYDLSGKIPFTTIKNYPVQGTGADVMSIIRIDFAKQFKKANYGVIIATVHDSIVVDIHKKYLDKVVELFNNCYKNMPSNFEAIFKKKYNLPIFNEIKYGPNMEDLIEYV